MYICAFTQPLGVVEVEMRTGGVANLNKEKPCSRFVCLCIFHVYQYPTHLFVFVSRFEPDRPLNGSQIRRDGCGAG